MENQLEEIKPQSIDFKNLEDAEQKDNSYNYRVIWHILVFGGLGIFSYIDRPIWVFFAVIVASILYFPTNNKPKQSD